MNIRTLSIIVPAYNEGPTIRLILDKLNELQLIEDIQKEIIVVNDCSRDNTEQEVMQYMAAHPACNIQYHKHEVNRGKGAALHTGIAKATGEFLVIQDADLECDPQDFNDMLVPVVRGMADVVYGSRFLGVKPRRVLSLFHTYVNQFLTFLSNLFTGFNMTDMETCYKMFDTKLVQGLKLQEERFGFEPEVTARLAKIKDLRLYEVGIAYYARNHADGKKIGWRDGVRAVYCIVKYNLWG